MPVGESVDGWKTITSDKGTAFDGLFYVYIRTTEAMWRRTMRNGVRHVHRCRGVCRFWEPYLKVAVIGNAL